MPTNTYVALDKQNLTTATAEVTFSNLGSYTDIIVVSNFGTTVAGNTVGLRFNGDTGSNYSTTQVNGPMPFGGSWRGSNQTSITVFGSPIVDGTPSTLRANGTIHIQNYGNSTTNKTVLSRYGYATGEVIAGVGLWRNTNAITSITLVALGTTFLAGSTFSLYGIAATSVGAKATGGDIYADSQYYYHVFDSTGTFTPLQSLTCDYLVIAGGGSGGCYTPAAGYNNGNPGNNSSIAGSGLTTITATGGGYGGYYNNNPGGAGGSGGGGGRSNSGTPTAGAVGGTRTASPVQGFDGGQGGGDGRGGGGGGGAGAAGGGGSTSPGGLGGAGLLLTAFSNATGTGVSGYYAGGGGGNFTSGPTNSANGGAGGGGAGAFGASAVSGTVNTGSGGGAADSGVGAAGGGGGAGGLRSTVTATGGGGSPESQLSLTSSTAYTITVGAGGAAVGGGGTGTSGAGGSGIVIVRYAK